MKKERKKEKITKNKQQTTTCEQLTRYTPPSSNELTKVTPGNWTHYLGERTTLWVDGFVLYWLIKEKSINSFCLVFARRSSQASWRSEGTSCWARNWRWSLRTTPNCEPLSQPPRWLVRNSPTYQLSPSACWLTPLYVHSLTLQRHGL